MQRFKNILLMVENGAPKSHAFDRAVALALRNSAQLTVAAAIETLPCEMRRLVPAIGLADLLEIAADEELTRLQGLVEAERHHGLQITPRVLFGQPFLEIIREVLRERHDLVMMMAEDKGELGESMFGSTSMHLMRKCPCPVWVMSSAQRHKYSRVLAAVDPLTSDEVHQALNSKILELAISMARTEEADLHIVHAWQPLTEKFILPRDRLSSEQKAEVDRDCAAAHERAFCDLLSKFDAHDVRVHSHLIKGQAGEIIPVLARNKHVDVIVMGTVCRTGIAGFFIGNTAEKVLRRVSCSVLTVKPDGFATPVKLC